MIRELRPGDVFASPLPNGQFGAVKILRTQPSFALVAVSKWIGDSLPTTTTPGLRELCSGLTSGPVHLRSELEASWYPGAPPSDVVFVGNVPLSDEEAKYETPDCANEWHPFMAAAVLVREKGMSSDELWRLIREQFPRARVSERPAAPMALARFWRLIEQTEPCKDNARGLVNVLARVAPAAIRSFHERLARLLWQLDAPAYAQRGENEPTDYLSPDRFLYQRCWVVGRGRLLYEAIRADPLKMRVAGECEDLIAAGPQALARAEKASDEAHIPTSVSFETYSNTAAWKGPSAV